jgi:hypothetical protein
MLMIAYTSFITITLIRTIAKAYRTGRKFLRNHSIFVMTFYLTHCPMLYFGAIFDSEDMRYIRTVISI